MPCIQWRTMPALQSEREGEARGSHGGVATIATHILATQLEARTSRWTRSQVESEHGAVPRQTDAAQRPPLLEADKAGIEHRAAGRQGAAPFGTRIEAERASAREMPDACQF